MKTGNQKRSAARARPCVLLAACCLASALWAEEPVAADRILRLRADIARHDDLYFKRAEPEITDFAYDELKRELAALEREVAGDSAAPVMGDDRTGKFPTYRHRVAMLGLQKSHAEPELRAFLQKTAGQLGRDDLVYVVEPKFDGLAISVTYEDGKLVRAVTRGNGVEGDDVTANVRTIRGLPAELKPNGAGNPPIATPGVVELRGEIYVSHAEFARINREREAAGLSPFSHPRNLAAGTLKSLDPVDVASRKLEIAFYGWGAWEPGSSAPASQQEFHRWVHHFGLPAITHYRVASTADEVWSAVQRLGKERRGFDFPTDGAVVKLDSVERQRQAGIGEDAPHWAMAYKFAPERAVTRLNAIRLQVGRTGVLTPVAELEPVRLGGATVSRASLYNREQIARGDYRLGDYVWVEKAGEIIPRITGVDLSRRQPGLPPYEFPEVCPACQSALVQLGGETAIRCSNAACPAQVRKRVEHFASKACVDIAGLGPATIDALVAAGRLGNVADIYRLTRVDLLAVPRTGERSAKRLLEAIERSKRAELWRFVYGLGIPGVGPANAKELATRYGSLEALENQLDAPEYRTLVQQLLSVGVQPAAK